MPKESQYNPRPDSSAYNQAGMPVLELFYRRYWAGGDEQPKEGSKEALELPLLSQACAFVDADDSDSDSDSDSEGSGDENEEQGEEQIIISPGWHPRPAAAPSWRILKSPRTQIWPEKLQQVESPAHQTGADNSTSALCAVDPAGLATFLQVDSSLQLDRKMIEELSQHETPDTIEIPDFLPMPSHTIQRVPATIMKFDNDRDRWEPATLLPAPKWGAGHTI